MTGLGRGGAAPPLEEDATWSDEQLIAEALRAVDDARARAPRDFLVALATLLGVAAAALLASGLISTGPLRDVSFNLAAEVLGTLLTVVVIDGWWRRRQAGASETLDRLRTVLHGSRQEPLRDTERRAWSAFVADYRAALQRETFGDRVRALLSYGHRIRQIEARANRALGEADAAGTTDARGVR